MLKITSLEDLNNNVIDDSIKAVIKNELNRLLTSYKIDNIKEFASMFVIEQDSDLDRFSEMGLSEPIEQYLFEFIDKIHIKKCSQEYIILLGCIIISDDYGIDIIVREDILTDKHKKVFISSIMNNEYLDMTQNKERTK